MYFFVQRARLYISELTRSSQVKFRDGQFLKIYFLFICSCAVTQGINDVNQEQSNFIRSMSHSSKHHKTPYQALSIRCSIHCLENRLQTSVKYTGVNRLTRAMISSVISYKHETSNNNIKTAHITMTIEKTGQRLAQLSNNGLNKCKVQRT